MIFRAHNRSMRTALLLVASYCLLVTMLGCEAFVRKFTRKHKKKDVSREEMVVAPEEYKGPEMTREELYRQYLLYWKSWHDELIGSLTRNSNHKKQVDCAGEAIRNLEQLRALLAQADQVRLDTYISRMNELSSSISSDIYGAAVADNRRIAEQIRRNILKDFSYHKIRF